MNNNNINDKTAEMLLSRARAAMLHAYAPYSHFNVGAAILFDDDTVFTGCNVENSSYSLSICAERNAMTTAVANGLTKPLAIAIVCRDGTFCPPCGACRQFLCEFNPDMTVILDPAPDSSDEKYVSLALKDLLPYSFDAENLKDRKGE
ncbi:MAG: cytidine deaminase [Synergistes sp.]|nr:cytidine deaminase [Synergistes sp.]